MRKLRFLTIKGEVSHYPFSPYRGGNRLCGDEDTAFFREFLGFVDGAGLSERYGFVNKELRQFTDNKTLVTVNAGN